MLQGLSWRSLRSISLSSAPTGVAKAAAAAAARAAGQGAAPRRRFSGMAGRSGGSLGAGGGVLDLPTADLCDRFGDELRYVAEMGLRDFGGVRHFAGAVSTVLCLDDNTRIKEAVSEPGLGRVLVVHCGGSLQRAVVGDQMAAAAIQNGWAGFIINGCIRDSVELAGMQIGIKALGAHPRKTERRGDGKRDVAVTFGGVTFHPAQDFVVADEDGVVVGPIKLLPKTKL